MREDSKTLFEDMPVYQAILKLAVPAVLGQIILVIYNMADTYFIGLTCDDAKMTAVTICMPAFMFLSAISNLFGVGGAATISRALGRNKMNRAHNASAFALYGCLLTTFFYSLLVYLLRHQFINFLGGYHSAVHYNSVQYILVTVVLGGIFTSTNALLAHLVRSEGRSSQASIGMMLGGIMNIILDPLFMFVILPKGMETLGAAIATALSNLIAFLYYVVLWLAIRKKGTALTFMPHEDAFLDGSAREILITGLPACLMTLCENISYAVLDHLMAYAGMMALAGIGVAKKINMLAHCIVRGMAQGVLPLIAYSYASKNYERMKHTILYSSLLSVGLSVITMAIFFTYAHGLVSIFINTDSESLIYGTRFLRILCLGCPFSAFAYAIISFFQAIGKSLKSLLLAILRKGALDIPLMFIINMLIPTYGIVLATPLADIICCIIAIILFIRCIHSLEERIIPTYIKARLN